jgi:lipopolysaccharide assembly outer membrane protein LptD (OstA)
MKKTILFALTLSALASQAQFLKMLETDYNEPLETETQSDVTNSAMQVSGDYFSASKNTGAMTATGNVKAVSHPFKFNSESVMRDEFGTFSFGKGASCTTCTNDEEHLHWKIKGTFTYADDSAKMMTNSYLHVVAGGAVNEGKRAILIEDAWLHLFDVPVLWIPWWYYPMDTNYGYRFRPGYTSRWGGYFLSGYVYNIYNEDVPDKVGFGGSTYADVRTKNGVALGQTLRWQLRNWGEGKVKVYHAWDEDYDRYARNWSRSKRNYRNWGSDVDRERYQVMFRHYGDVTERDSIRMQATYVSDSWVRRDFFRDEERGESVPINEIAYEHRENDWSSGASVAGPLNSFYGGVARLPEAWIAINPQPVWELPINYESQTRAGYLNRSPSRYSDDADKFFHYAPYIGVDGKGADYQAFRADSFHRFSAPMKFADAVSFVPRTSYRGTYWSDSGDTRAFDQGSTKASGEALYRSIAEFGFTLSARAYSWLNDNWRHTFEPYLDYSYQVAESHSSNGKRAYVFDSYDGVMDWLDQFGFEGRGLPYNWNGVRPGIRNIFQERDENGIQRTIADIDLYAALAFEDYDRHSKSSVLAGYPKDNDDPHYSHKNDMVPGVRIRVNPWRDVLFATRTEYDVQNDKVAYSDIIFRHQIFEEFAYNIGYVGRNHRIWDYLPSPNERWNLEKSSIIQVGFEHKLCDTLSWAPYVRYDCRLNELEEIGVWFDMMTDCIGLRTAITYESEFDRMDGSEYEDDFSVAFYIYLRAFGSASAFDMGKF